MTGISNNATMGGGQQAGRGGRGGLSTINIGQGSYKLYAKNDVKSMEKIF